MISRFLSVCTTTVFFLSAPAFAAIDLVPDVAQLSSGTIRVVNNGKDAAPASQLTIVCQKQGGGSCPEAPGMAAYENPAYPNAATVDVPVLAPGADHSHALSFWGDLTWTPGTYNLTVSIDVGNAAAESNEGNNGAVAQKVVLPASVSGGTGKIGGFAAKPPPQKIAPLVAKDLVAGLPDLMGTTLGFAVNGYVEWGGSTTIDTMNQVKATKAGPNQNLCIIGTGLYRTFNKGTVAALNFIDVVYRNGVPIYTRHVASLAPQQSVNFENHDLPFQEGMNVLQVKMDAGNAVSETNENNTFEVKVMVKLDCNGDGVVPGVVSQKILNPTAPAPQKTPARNSRDMQLKTR